MKKGFTLIEMIGVIILIGVLALITVPTVNVVIKNGKQDALNETISNIEAAAYSYSNRHDIGYSSETKALQLSTLKEAGVLTDEAIINPVTNSEIEGCVLYRWDENNKQYQFNYDVDCEIKDLEVKIENLTGKFNENDWAKEDFFVSIETTGNSYNYCISTKKCSPNTKVSSNKGTADITIESKNIYVCAYAIDGNMTSEIVCSEPYKLDKTAPTPGTLNITGDKVNNNNEWYISNVSFTVSDGYDDLSGHLSTTSNAVEITQNTASTNYTVTTKDNAGNVSTRDYNFKVDKNDPTVTINRTVSNNKNVLTATVNPTETTSGYTYQWYKNNNKISGANLNTYTTEEAGTFKLELTTGSGKVVYSNEITINSYIVKYDLNGGTGNIPNDTKIEDLTLKLSTTIPIRTGYEFMGWGLTSSDKVKTYNSGDNYTNNENVTLYAIWKKGYTYTFVSNGATLSSESETCYIYNAETNCNITTPTITRNTHTVIGFNKDKNAKTEEFKHNTIISINSNETYYAITSRVLIAKFNANGATLSSTSNLNCTIYNTQTECSVTAPTITRSTHNVIGFNTNATDKTNNSAYNTSTKKLTITESTHNITWYAITSRTLIAKFNGNGASLSSTSDLNCTIYNTETSCKLTAPTITRTNFTIIGYNTSATDKTNNSSYNTSTKELTLTESNHNSTWYAITSRVLIAKFNANGASLSSTSNLNCTIYNTETSCDVTAPTITRTNFTIIGYNTSATDKTNNTAYNTSTKKLTLTESNHNSTWYAITSRKLIAKFNANGASLSSTSDLDCTIYNTETSCKLTAPTITRTNFSIVGYNTSSSVTTNNSAYNTSTKELTLTESNHNSTWYAITSRTITITFYRNGAVSLTPSGGSKNTATSLTQECIINNSATTCNITSPKIEASSNTPTVIGWDSTSAYTSNEWTVNTSKAFNSNMSYYAVTMKETVRYNITYTKGTGVSAIGATSGYCDIAATYNGTAQSTTCSITLPTINVSAGYETPGWYNSSNTKVGNASASASVSASQTLTAKATLKSFACSAGYYLAANNETSCTKCEAGSYCPGGTYSYSSSTQGKNSCPSGYGSSSAGSNSSDDCYLTTTSGNYIATAYSSSQTTCTSGYYCPSTTIYYGSTGGRSGCPSGYSSSAAGSNSSDDCYLTTTSGNYIATAYSSSQTQCQSGYYCPSTTIYYGSTGGRNSCPSGYGSSPTGSTSASDCYLTTTAGKYIGTVNSSTQYTCSSGWYCPSEKVNYGSKGGYRACPSGYGTSPTGSTSASDCYLTTTAGKYIGTVNSSTQYTCSSGWYCPSEKVNYGSKGGYRACPSGYGTSPTGSTSASDCYKVITVSYSGNGATSGSTGSSTCNLNYGNSSCSITLSSSGFSRTNYSFIGWSTGTSSVTHSAGSSYSFSSNTTLNAIWKANYICSTGTLTADSSLGANSGGYICVANNPSSYYERKYYTRSENSFSCSDSYNQTSCSASGSSSGLSYTTCSNGGYSSWTSTGTSNVSSCSGYNTSTSQCSGTSCTTCSSSGGGTTTVYTLTNYTRTYTNKGGAWCLSYTYAIDSSTARNITVNENEPPCKGTTECTYVECHKYPDEQEPEGVDYYVCYDKYVTGCARFNTTCVSLSNFNSSHTEGEDYTSCTKDFYGSWTVSSTQTNLTSCSGELSLNNCSGTTCPVCTSSTTTAPTTYTTTSYSRNQLYTKTTCSRSSIYGSWNYQGSEYGLTSCSATDDSTATTWDYDCSSYYSCPSGWTTYSGNGSSMQCYKAATTG